MSVPSLEAFKYWKRSNGEEISTVGGRVSVTSKSLSTIKHFCDSDMSHRIRR